MSVGVVILIALIVLAARYAIYKPEYHPRPAASRRPARSPQPSSQAAYAWIEDLINNDPNI